MNNLHSSFIAHISSYSPSLHNLIQDIANYEPVEYLNSKVSLSFIIMCKDEERSIERCITTIMEDKDTDDEIIVIDTGSTDRTLELLNPYIHDIKIVQTDWNNDFAAVRNFGLQQASHEWVFFIDADESLVKGSVGNLKNHIQVIHHFALKHIVINPTIINSSGHIVQGVRRILNTCDPIYYYGVIHEEPRLDLSKLGSDINELSFDDIQLQHDGYETAIVKSKNKMLRNVNLLKLMVEQEPHYPRWTYFLCRDGKETWSEETYHDLLQKTVTLCADEPYFAQYKLRAISDLIGFYIQAGQIEHAEHFVEMLKQINPNVSDVFYYETLIEMIKTKAHYFSLLQRTIDFKQSQTTIDYGSMHSNLFHIDALIGELFFEINQYDKAFNIFEKLEQHQFGNYKERYKPLNMALHTHLYKDKTLNTGENKSK